jgi:hypothetical protein
MYLQFTAHIRKKDFVRLFFSLTLRKPAIVISILLGLGLLVFVALNYLHFFRPGLLKNPLFMLFIGIASILYLLFGIYRSAVKNYAAHERLNQELTYLLTDDMVSYSGAEFTNEFKWESFYKIESIGNDWIILYNSKTVANFLPIGGLTGAQVEQLREFLKANKTRWTTKIKI